MFMTLRPNRKKNFPWVKSTRKLAGIARILGIPLLREDVAIGVLAIRRMEVRPFTDKQITLLKTFADQAVIAIENVRLFQQLEARTHALSRSVGELKALGEVGQAVSSTLDLQTVLSTIVGRAVQLSATDCGIIYEYDEPPKNFTFAPTTKWKRNWLTLIEQPRSVWDKEPPVERRKPEYRYK